MKGKIAVLVLVVLLVGCGIQPQSESLDDFNAKYNYEVFDTNVYDITKQDALELLRKREIKSTNIAVNGVKLGDRYLDVQKKLGLPDYVEDYYSGATNLKYEKDGEPYLIIHLDDNTVTRISVKPTMADEIDSTVEFGMALRDITPMFGKPAKTEDTKFLRIYYYKPRGLELYIKAKKLVGFGLVPPEEI